MIDRIGDMIALGALHLTLVSDSGESLFAAPIPFQQIVGGASLIFPQAGSLVVQVVRLTSLALSRTLPIADSGRWRVGPCAPPRAYQQRRPLAGRQISHHHTRPSYSHPWH
ncbi:hypothetical protein F0Q45_26095 [Mycobacterium simiae]|uniref:Uncharacterized protein n=1 Tax=Mycobacterium simiae TaxID=1784 RepID=A0A5B1B4E8_MYCSI|nr:hypothetical protein F0Q45_26095 [Mycobacterium simiae]